MTIHTTYGDISTQTELKATHERRDSFQMKKALLLVLALIIIFVLGEAALFFTGLLPQEPIRSSIEESLVQMESEYEKQFVLYDKSRNTIGNFTDCLILNLSYYSDTSSDPLSILSNPRYRDKGESTVSDLTKLVSGEPANSNYLHYCMGFRIWMRPLLSVFNYMQIRSIFGSVLWMLFALSVLTVHRLTKHGFFSALYALCFVALNPTGISGTLSYMVCFLIGFLGVIVLPYIVQRRKDKPIILPLFFLTLGAVTQFFDFYTNPLITFAFPMMVLLFSLLSGPDSITTKESFRILFSGLIAWASAYVGIWLMKLLATALLTGLDVVTTTMETVRASIGIATESSGIGATLAACAKNIASPEILVALGIVCVVGVVRLIRNPDRKTDLKQSWIFLIIGALSLVWILFAKRTMEHVHFQYRTLGVLLLGVLAFIASAAGQKETRR